MSVNNFFGNKKRNSSILYDVDQTKITSPLQRSMSHNNIGNHGEGLPPNKRYKSVVSSKCKETEDPFGDNDDFTVDDLKEIDIIASQALTQDVSSETNLLKTEQNAQLSIFPNSTNQFKTPDQWNIALTTETKSLENSIEEMKLKERFKLETVQAQFKEAMKKLKEMQDEILIKNGEIKILRDSMQQMESTVEDQRKSYILLERENAQCLNEKEKEFSRKLQSLQSELHFRDAEMNELRTKILNCERIKPVAPVSYTSPKKSPSKPLKSERCTHIEKKSYPTEESFGSRVLPIPSCSRTQSHVQAPQENNDSKTTVLETEPVKQETSFSCPQRPGSLLLNALLKQPLVPGSSLGICNLLSSNTEAWFGSAMQSASFSVGPTQKNNNKITSLQEGETSLRTTQKLALTGLNLIAVDGGSLEGQQNRRHVPHLKCVKIPGAVHLLPLLELHIGAYNQALLSVTKTGSISSGNQSACTSGTSSGAASSVEDTLSTLEEYALVSLGILYYLVFYSWEVINTLLSHDKKADCNPGAIDVSEKNETVACSKQDTANLQETIPELEVASLDKSQHPLFKKLLQLLSLCVTSAGCQKCHIANQCLKVLVKLAEKSTVDLLISFQCLFDSQSQILLRCISSETPLFAVLLTVRMLSLLAEHQDLAARFCSCSETCLLLALYMYITSRPDKLASEGLWLQLEQETVRFLTKCMQCCRSSVLLVGTDCQCTSEAVKALIVMLHRQWLLIRKMEGIVFNGHEKQIVQFLRDAVLLLHGLSQKDKLFHEHSLEVLHQYDGVLSGVTAVLRKGQHLKACEELALDELYSLEPEVSDQEMDCR
ncbi:ATR-interacting protein [Pantherophis guttatus]|uniref:ATR-interacting protein n=1 Tax=Pantherophis guttatus TaxID=94885 RepID=A0A6P9DEC1_PANGU|nr:ATR-interacting protein [Pantherophis guttatus]XP_034294623.1 ATR-interacting protein [Pantherophis guttatus]XP_034294631.1 ATR-interacting protein [Pantherophis guttatus]XP_034294639.1 ATR-interacting protein [Pantherophis guttatus]XP_034294649.1 ATR-interacting protein [Pantherophis guttatus]XP_034294654.1 ATR-interacting protein [Pantherophis guttatus]